MKRSYKSGISTAIRRVKALFGTKVEPHFWGVHFHSLLLGRPVVERIKVRKRFNHIALRNLKDIPIYID